MLATNLSRSGVERLSFFQDPMARRDTWQERSTYFQNGAIWVGVLSMVPVFLSHYVSQWWTAAGFGVACALYVGSEKCSGRAADWTLRAEAFHCVQNDTELGSEVVRLCSALEELKKVPSNGLLTPVLNLFKSTPIQPHPLQESASNRDGEWSKACDDLAGVAREVGKNNLFTGERPTLYRGALLYTLQQTVAALQSVGKSPEEGGRWDLFLGQKLQLAYLLSWMRRVDFDLREDHPRAKALKSWESITQSVGDTSQDRANLISIHNASLKSLYVGKKPISPEYEKESK